MLATPNGMKYSPLGTGPLVANRALGSSINTGSLRAVGRFHQSLGVGRIRRNDDDQTGAMGPDRMIRAAVMRAGAFDRAPARPHDRRHAELAVAHVAELGPLLDDLAWRPRT